MVKKMISFILFIGVSLANQIEIKALNFYSDENKGESILSGDVQIIRGDDVLNAQRVIIYTDKDRKPIRYEAMEDAHFRIVLKDKIYEGNGDKFIYNIASDIYEIDGNVYINELQSNQKLYADKIIVDRKNNTYRVQSKDKKPARFIFDLELK